MVRDIVAAGVGVGIRTRGSARLRGGTGSRAEGLLPGRQLHFFYGARTPRDVCGETLLRALPGFGASLHFHPVVSDIHSAEAAGWRGERGFVHEALPRILGDQLASCEFYLAGPPPMTQAIQELLMSRCLVPYQHIHFDRFF